MNVKSGMAIVFCSGRNLVLDPPRTRHLACSIESPKSPSLVSRGECL